MKKSLTLFAMLVAVSVVADGGLAAKGPKPGKGPTGATGATGATGPQCKAPRAAMLGGTFVSAAGSSFTMDVTKANAQARKLKGKKGYEVSTDAKTKIVRRGKGATLADLKAGDRLNVQGVLCKGTDAETAKLVARRVVAQPKKAEEAAPAPEAGATDG
jgi:hypothetical protein